MTSFLAGEKVTADELNTGIDSIITSTLSYVGGTSWTADSSTTGATETIFKSVTVDALSTVQYVIEFDTGYSNPTGSGTPLVTWTLRSAGGGTVSTSGTLRYSRKRPVDVNSGFNAHAGRCLPFTGTPTTGVMTVGLGMSIDAGTVRLAGDAANIGYLAVYAVGPA